METVQLTVQSRDTGVKPNQLRSQSVLPGVCYGNKGDNLNVQVDYQTFRKVYIKAGENTIVDLSVDGKDPVKVLVHALDYNAMTDQFSHVDFIRIDMKKPVTTNVRIVAEDFSPAVKDLGGVLVHNKDTVEVKCLPGDLIHEIKVSLSPLVDFHHSIHVSDLEVPDTVEILDDPALTVLSVSAPRAIIEEETAAEGVTADGIAIEAGEEGEEGAEAPADDKKEEEAKEE